MTKPFDESTPEQPDDDRDEIDDLLDYEAIVTRSEADREAGRVLSREEMRARTERKLAELRAKRRSA